MFGVLFTAFSDGFLNAKFVARLKEKTRNSPAGLKKRSDNFYGYRILFNIIYNIIQPLINFCNSFLHISLFSIKFLAERSR